MGCGGGVGGVGGVGVFEVGVCVVVVVVVHVIAVVIGFDVDLGFDFFQVDVFFPLFGFVLPDLGEFGCGFGGPVCEYGS